jgi:hypothetical protein
MATRVVGNKKGDGDGDKEGNGNQPDLEIGRPKQID